MSTNLLRQKNNSYIRNAVGVNSITKEDHAEINDIIADELDTLESIVDSIKIGIENWFYNSSMETPLSDMTLWVQDAIADQPYTNLKLADGTNAPGIAFTAKEIESPFKYLVYNANNNTWSKRVSQIDISLKGSDKEGVDKANDALQYSEITTNPVKNITTGNLAIDNTGYGPTERGWGFPIGAWRNIGKVGLRIGANGVTQIRLIIKEINYYGTILYDYTYTGAFINGINVLDLINVVKNESNSRLWLEYYCNVTNRIFRTGATAQIYTVQNDYPQIAYTAANDMGESGMQNLAGGYMDMYAEIYTVDVENKIEPSTAFMQSILNILPASPESKMIPYKNLYFLFILSSVTWGGGRTQSGYVAYAIWLIQERLADTLLNTDVEYSSAPEVLNYISLYRQSASKLTGVGEYISFKTKGDELSICFAKDRQNIGAALVDVYSDDVLYSTIDTTNKNPFGSATKSFTGDGTAIKFDLGMGKTYNHVVKKNGVTLTGKMNTGTLGSASVTDDYLVIMKYGSDANGNPEVHHYVWFKTAPASGDVIAVSFDYGTYASYEKTAMGYTGDMTPENAYADGLKSFDTTQPASISSGTHFRGVDKEIISTFRFTENKERNIKLVIRALADGSTGTPSFTFNFATNRVHYFMNGGIGGFSLWDANEGLDTNYLMGYQRMLEFKPDYIIADTAPNEDWKVKGQRLFMEWAGITESQMKNDNSLPIRRVLYDSGTDTFTYSKWVGKIASITEISATLSDDTQIQSVPVAGDYVFLGEPGVYNKNYITRKIKSYDAATRLITWINPIDPNEFAYSTLNDFVGMQLRVRDYTAYKNQLQIFLDNIKDVLPQTKVGIIPSPYPNLQNRELWAYNEATDDVLKSYKNCSRINTEPLRAWQNSIPATLQYSINSSAFQYDPVSGVQVAMISVNVSSNNNAPGKYKIIANGVDITKYCWVEHGFGYRLSGTGAALNLGPTDVTNSKMVVASRQVRIFYFGSAPLSSTVTLSVPAEKWSNDCCHMTQPAGVALYSQMAFDFIRYNL